MSRTNNTAGGNLGTARGGGGAHSNLSTARGPRTDRHHPDTALGQVGDAAYYHESKLSSIVYPITS